MRLQVKSMPTADNKVIQLINVHDLVKTVDGKVGVVISRNGIYGYTVDFFDGTQQEYFHTELTLVSRGIPANMEGDDNVGNS